MPKTAKGSKSRRKPATKAVKTASSKPVDVKLAIVPDDHSTASHPVATGKMSALDAAAKVLAEAGEPLTAGALIAAMAAKQYWTSPGGKTPAATLHAALQREIRVKGTASRFKKTARGLFDLAK